MKKFFLLIVLFPVFAFAAPPDFYYSGGEFWYESTGAFNATFTVFNLTTSTSTELGPTTLTGQSTPYDAYGSNQWVGHGTAGDIFCLDMDDTTAGEHVSASFVAGNTTLTNYAYDGCYQAPPDSPVVIGGATSTLEQGQDNLAQAFWLYLACFFGVVWLLRKH